MSESTHRRYVVSVKYTGGPTYHWRSDGKEAAQGRFEFLVERAAVDWVKMYEIEVTENTVEIAAWKDTTNA